MKVLSQKWFVVDQPWGDGSWVRAGAPDAAGEFVCDCQVFLDESDLDRVETAQEIATHIVALHNSRLSHVNRLRSEICDHPCDEYFDLGSCRCSGHKSRFIESDV